MKIGIDKIGFYTPPIYVDMNELAHARGDEPEKYIIGIGQSQMAVSPLSQDIVSMAANAALQILDKDDLETIDLVIVGTESGFDASKSTAVYVHNLLGIQPNARSMEIKHACYGATAGIQMAKGHVALNPDRKALVIATDVARYGLATGGEVTQGAGAVALLISANPRLLSLESDSAYLSKDIMDFWRPTYSEYAMVDGKYSNEQYISFFLETWNLFKEKTDYRMEDIDAFCFHLPYTKMGLKALREILGETSEEKQTILKERFQASTLYSRNVGNIYTGSLYLSLLSLLENQAQLQPGDRIALFSYGSGAVGEFFTGILEENYEDQLLIESNQQTFSSRKEISVGEYERVFSQQLPQDGSEVVIATNEDPSKICLAGIKEHKRYYIVK
ncbi:hydroxymethylglutaryl-CoA synthase [Jeotgalibaca ciconiae]|uniref:Hydroxymethylglutaryl-CoA synthase n=1 Tax=Jeotgalibaca ciconiae TaxID=2496265 RepID=A0A3S9H803_9LACT|nr:hydroxymethylglutaryl-CoA synthase [Jeotgalibaca ciconiae]AZP03473.1 hydroxymethylglutaryl-CoA synthase [Jeotgalibaca ciconiae]HJB23262.1 hydroxymethylglutaryl-CoA synthase [Candidatus Jeotgalibaca pullicola]